MKEYICIDIGGTFVKYGIINENIEISHRALTPTRAHLGGQAILDQVQEIIQELLPFCRAEGICLSSAGMVDVEEGRILYSGPQIKDYAGTCFREILQREFSLPVEIENDVNCAGLAESISGAGAYTDKNLCLTVGTGIGGCFVNRRSVYHGSGYRACEVGYMQLGAGAFQDLASATALTAAVEETKGRKLSGREVFDLAGEGDPDCIEAIVRMTDCLAKGIANICYILDPDNIILGGGIMERKEYLSPLLEAALGKYLLGIFREHVKLSFARYGNDAGMVGALYSFGIQKEKRGQ